VHALGPARQARGASSAEWLLQAQILPVDVRVKGGTIPFGTDEHLRPDASLEGMAKAQARCWEPPPTWKASSKA